MVSNGIAVVSRLTATLLLCGSVMAQSIYTCIDSKGRKITADRQIPECSDRVQHEVSPGGVVKRVLGPTLTDHELAAEEEKSKLQNAARLRESEEKRRNRALLLRYPNMAAHDKERALAVAQIDALSDMAQARVKELATQRASIHADFEFYQKDPSKAPATLVRRRDENDGNMAEQKRYIAEKTLEKQRVNARFDSELVKLRQLWDAASAPVARPPAASPRDAVKH